jgi:hypothetical protein
MMNRKEKWLTPDRRRFPRASSTPRDPMPFGMSAKAWKTPVTMGGDVAL